MLPALDLDALVAAAELAGLAGRVPPVWLVAQNPRLAIVAASRNAASGSAGLPRGKSKALPWSPEDDAFLTANLGYLAEDEIARTLGRTRSAVKQRWKRNLQLPPPRRAPGWITPLKIAHSLGVAEHLIIGMIRTGSLPAEPLPWLNQGLYTTYRVRLVTFYRWAINPQHWIYFRPARVPDLHLRQQAGQKLLMLTGVRLGESAARDQRIALSCSRDSGECGQGWFQHATPEAVADTLAPLLHWRLCHVYDWLYFDERNPYDVRAIAAVYGDGDVRTGCIGCNLASRDTALERIIKHPEYAHLAPLMELRPLWAELKQPRWRKRKAAPEQLKDGSYSKNGQRMGPLTMSGRAYGLSRVLDIQARAGVDLINAEEEARIREMWRLNLWPRKWSDLDIAADVPIARITATPDGLVEQTLLFGA